MCNKKCYRLQKASHLPIEEGFYKKTPGHKYTKFLVLASVKYMNMGIFFLRICHLNRTMTQEKLIHLDMVYTYMRTM